MRELHFPSRLKDFKTDGYLFNVGPPIRHDSIAIKACVFGESEVSIRWDLIEVVGLDFENRSPIEVVERALAECGFTSCDELRDHYRIPQTTLACRVLPKDTKLPKAKTIGKRRLLRHALILGLCGPSIYDPQRPVIWTNNRLSRAIQLYAPGRFYANQ